MPVDKGSVVLSGPLTTNLSGGHILEEMNCQRNDANLTSPDRMVVKIKELQHMHESAKLHLCKSQNILAGKLRTEEAKIRKVLDFTGKENVPVTLSDAESKHYSVGNIQSVHSTSCINRQPTKKPFLKKRTGLLRFYSDPAAWDRRNSAIVGESQELASHNKRKDDEGKNSSISSDQGCLFQSSKLRRLSSKASDQNNKNIRFNDSFDTNDEKVELEIFEKMEKAAKRSSFSEGCRLVRKFLSQAPNLDDTLDAHCELSTIDEEAQSEISTTCPAESNAKNISNAKDSLDCLAKKKFLTEWQRLSPIVEAKRNETIRKYKTQLHKEFCNDHEVVEESDDSLSDRISTLSSTHSDNESIIHTPLTQILRTKQGGHQDLEVAFISQFGELNCMKSAKRDEHVSCSEDEAGVVPQQGDEACYHPDKKTACLKNTELTQVSLPFLENKEIKALPVQNAYSFSQIDHDSRFNVLAKEKKEVQEEKNLIAILRLKLEQEKNSLAIEKRRFQRYKVKELQNIKESRRALINQEEHFENLRDEIKKVREQNSKHLAELAVFKKKFHNISKELKIKTDEWEREEQMFKEQVEKLKLKNHKLEIAMKQKNGRTNKMMLEKNSIIEKLPSTTVPIIASSQGVQADELNEITVEGIENVLNEESKMTSIDSHSERLPSLTKNAIFNRDVSTPDSQFETFSPVNRTEWKLHQKVVCNDQKKIRVHYSNGDIKEVHPNGMTEYYFIKIGAKQTTHSDGTDVIEYFDGIVEKTHPNGTKDVAYPSGTVKQICKEGTQQWRYTDGTCMIVHQDGSKTIVLPNGQKEFHGNDFHKRVYPDGTEKIVYSDGSQETKYPNGRIRLKDSFGNLIKDELE